eukprot:Gregarina_sp_Pseudo_9__891@NODE_156_length_3937_cov_17_817599_g143_i0_p1_GENE_NODE_156_length_3937_cov_17_817599_g143_i0NODE_156_length_3937_cov_17_817599_g143_i0_p1_ORF_typecomplete_len930_score196_22XRN_N/PF03159_18/4_4e97XRN_N/PF03159_18/3_3e02XRN_M/PF17846_1/1_1e93SPASM/PF13186_6/0_2zfCCHC_6/PF15288_6/0_14zfCCHC_3/PF13917_6/0_25zfCCHC_4/PF14392_6/0_9_NODE_156_length_3937_cov_17_817599_g143_i011473906
MGVPTFYRWLCTKYPKVVKDVIEERQVYERATDSFIPSDLNAPNPNGLEFDNLYIDMNGVVHPCCHPEDTKQPESEAEMFQNLCDYMDRIVNIVRPRKLIYLALDGVAPRAKMNQQRSRRFKAAAEAEASEEAYEELRAEFERDGREIPVQTKKWDTNVITPGTSFMHRLAGVLRYYVCRRMAESTYWQGLKVLLSDSNVPGEGEHKVMAFVRQQRQQEGYDPNTKHCMHGMDADLIMLGLATHEAHFYVIREVVTDNKHEVKCVNCGRAGHSLTECRMPLRPDVSPPSPTKPPDPASEPCVADSLATHKSFRASWKPLQFLQLPVLREYLAIEFKWTPQELVTQDPVTGQIAQVPTDLERHIDDFVLLCFFVGNDFLPHLPSLSIQKGSIDQLTLLYKTIYPSLGGYLTNEGRLNIAPLRYLCSFLAQVEPEVLRFDHQRKVRNRRQREDQQQSDAKRRRLEPPNGDGVSRAASVASSGTTAPSKTPVERRNSFARSEASDDSSSVSALSPFPAGQAKVIEAELSQTHREAVDLFREKLKAKMTARTEVDDAVDDIELGAGDPNAYREKYYRVKFHLLPNDDVEKCAQRVSEHFVRGLEWVLLYYYQGVPTWEWFFPFHYAPLATDIHRYGLLTQGNSFEGAGPGTPFTPLEQLMGNLPPRSACFLPSCLGQLMTDPNSPLCDFYPKKFHEDPDGKRFRWQWVALVPFIDPDRLKAEARKRYAQLSPGEVERNTEGSDLLFVHAQNAALEQEAQQIVKAKAATKQITTAQFGVTLLFSSPSRPNLMLKKGRAVLVDCDGFPEIQQTCTVVPVAHPQTKRHWCRQLEGAIPPSRCLSVQDELDQDRGAGNRFNSKVAKRMIMQVVGGPHYDAYREKEDREREAHRSYNPSHIPNNPLVENIQPARGSQNPFLPRQPRFQ